MEAMRDVGSERYLRVNKGTYRLTAYEQKGAERKKNKSGMTLKYLA